MARRLKMFIDAYGLTDRAGFIDEICDRIARSISKMIDDSHQTGASVADFVAVLESDIEFIRSHRIALETAIATEFDAQVAA